MVNSFEQVVFGAEEPPRGQKPDPKEWKRYKYYTELGKMFGLVNNESLNIVWRKAETSWNNERQRRSITNRVNNLRG